MKNKSTIYYIILAVLLTILVLVEYFAPQPINWKQSFEKKDKIPYGTYILNKLLPGSFHKNIRTNNLSFFEFSLYEDLNEKSCYLILTSAFNPDDFDLEKMLEYTETGNEIFIATAVLGDNFLDTLGLGLETTWFYGSTDSLELKLVNPAFQEPYLFSRSLYFNFINNFNDSTTKVLGLNDRGQVNFVKINYGDGAFYINTQPLAFTNYHLLYSNGEYAFGALSYLSENRLWFDEYYKPFRTQAQTPFRYILSNRSFKTALYLILIGLLLYLVFESKRKQRAIPVIEPYKNTSLEFTRMIGKLYLRKRNHKDLANKKIRYFFENLRNRYFIDTNNINQEVLTELSQKSGVPEEQIRKLFDNIAYVNDRPSLADHDIIVLNNLIEEFKKLSK